MIEARCCANHLRRDAEMVAERAGEGFVRAVVGIQREAENVGRAGGERARRFAQPARAHIAHHRKAGRGGERPHQMEARDAGNAETSSSVNGPARWLSMYQSAFWAGFIGDGFLSKRPHHERLPRAAFDRRCSCGRHSVARNCVAAHRPEWRLYFAAGAASLAAGASAFFFNSSAVFFCRSSTNFCSAITVPFSASICRLAASSFC